MSKVLILYDEPYVRVILSEVLSKEGYQVVSVDNVGLMWDYIRNSPPDLVLLDSRSDGFNIWGLTDDIKEKKQDLPVLAYTVNGMEDIRKLKVIVAETLGSKTPRQAVAKEPYLGHGVEIDKRQNNYSQKAIRHGQQF